MIMADNSKLLGHKWTHTLDLSEAWPQAEREEITTAQLGRLIAEGLESLTKFYPFDDDLNNLIADMQEVSADPDEFNVLMDVLYDWADQDKRLWIKRF